MDTVEVMPTYTQVELIVIAKLFSMERAVPCTVVTMIVVSRHSRRQACSGGAVSRKVQNSLYSKRNLLADDKDNA